MPSHFSSHFDPEEGLLQQLDRTFSRLRDTQDVGTILRRTLRFAQDYFGAAEACLAVGSDVGQGLVIEFGLPKEAAWDVEEFTAFLNRDKQPPSPHQLLARLKRRERTWGLICVRDERQEFGWQHRRALSVIGNRLSQAVQDADQKRIRDVRARIDRKIMEQLRPKDLFYQVLHGLRSLTRYDHSSSLLISDSDLTQLEVVAEQIAWRKGKSARVGSKIPVTASVRSLFARDGVYAFLRDENLQWRELRDYSATELADLLDYNYHAPENPSDPVEFAMICAPFVLKDRRLGVLKIAAEQPGLLELYEANLVSEFVPHVVIALQNAQKAESLEQNVLAFERKSAMADLAKGVSHDINNSLGIVIPLVQQMREDLRSGSWEPSTFDADLAEIEQAMLLCRRVFGGMLRIARGATPLPQELVLAREVDATLLVLGESLRRSGIAVRTRLDAEQRVVGVQADVQQLLLNLLGNAREAMQSGGRIDIDVSADRGLVHLCIADTGTGIPDSHVKKVLEPFFTTKRGGNGLGLAICHSIVSQMHGRLEIASQLNHGTQVHAYFPSARGLVL